MSGFNQVCAQNEVFASHYVKNGDIRDLFCGKQTRQKLKSQMTEPFTLILVNSRVSNSKLNLFFNSKTSN